MSESTGPLFNSPTVPRLHTRVWRLIRWAPHRWHHLCAYRSCAPNLYSSAIVATANRGTGATCGLNAPTSSTPRAAPARLRAAHPAGHRHGGVGPFTGVPVGAAQVPARSSACRGSISPRVPRRMPQGAARPHRGCMRSQRIHRRHYEDPSRRAGPPNARNPPWPWPPPAGAGRWAGGAVTETAGRALPSSSFAAAQRMNHGVRRNCLPVPRGRSVV